jgi:hypothetical protein
MNSSGGKNTVAFLICSAIGFIVGRQLPAGDWSTYTSILLSYHLFLGWLVLTAEHEAGFSMPIVSTIITHLACVTLVVAFAVGRHAIPFFGVIRYLIPGLAPFERDWLFRGDSSKREDSSKKEKTPAAVPATKRATKPDAAIDAVDAAAARAAIVDSATGEDYEAWRNYLINRNPRSRKPGMSIKEEYETWLIARVKNREAEAAAADVNPA